MWPFNRKQKALNSLPSSGGGWWPLVREPFAGAWQQNKEITRESVRDFFAIYACKTLIAGDISKLDPQIKKQTSSGVWKFQADKNYNLLKQPNHYQNGMQFLQWWLTSKLEHGNTYVLKQRVGNEIKALYILDPSKVTPLVADNGDVYYQLSLDNLNELNETQTVVAASEIIHDRYQPIFHPLVGVSPVYAAALAGALGKQIQEDAYSFIQNGANVSGILSAPGAISKDTAEALSEKWNANYTGRKAGKVAVVGDGLKFEAMRAKGVDSQIVEHLKLSAEIVASCFHVPAYKIGMGTSTGKPQEANLAYYSDCLQVLIEEIEACLDRGLGLKQGVERVEFDTDDLMRMDAATIYDTLAKGVGGSITTPNEARLKVGLKPLDGGDSIYMQQQNYSLEALSKRDALDDPFGNGKQQPVTLPEPEPKPEPEPEPEQKTYDYAAWSNIIKEAISA